MMVGDGVRLWCWSCVFYIQLLGDEGGEGVPAEGWGACLETGAAV